MEYIFVRNMGKTMANLVILIPSLEVGGTEKQVLILTKKMRKLEIKFEIYSLKGGKLVEQFHAEGIYPKILEYKIFNIRLEKLAILAEFVVLFRKNNFIIDAYLPLQAIIATFIKMIKGQKVFLIINRRSETIYRKKFSLISFLDSVASRRADVLTVNNEALVSQYASIDNVEISKIILLNNDLIYDTGNSVRNVVMSTGETTIFCTANHNPIKGIPYLLDAFSRIDQLKFPSRLILIGTGKQTPYLLEKVKKQKISQVTFIQDTLNPTEHYIPDSIFILPSLSEGTSNALLEAMAFGMACIVTNCQGNIQILQENCLYIMPKNVDDIYDKLMLLIKNHELRSKYEKLSRISAMNYSRMKSGSSAKVEIIRKSKLFNP